ncbi:MAG: DUF6089 family protein [Bacteroidota bacterium]
MKSTLQIFCVLILVILFSFSAKAQFKELGIGVGAFNYTGDLVRGYDFSFNRPAVHIFYRRNTRDHVSFRYEIAGGQLAGNDDDPIDALAIERNASFDIFILEGSASFEYNFLDFRKEGAVVDFTPYFTGGIGVMRMFDVGERNGDFDLTQPFIPFGVGIKRAFSNNINVDFRFTARKVFTDYLDNVSGGDVRFKDFNFGNDNDSDWYYHVGISISYVFYTLPCPFPYF